MSGRPRLLQDCRAAGCGEGWAWGCPHGQWCVTHTFAHMAADPDCRPLLGSALLKYLRLIALPAHNLGEQIAPARCVLLDLLQELHRHFYPHVAAAYEDAGAPLGDAEDAPLRWLEAQYDDAPAH